MESVTSELVYDLNNPWQRKEKACYHHAKTQQTYPMPIVTMFAIGKLVSVITAYLKVTENRSRRGSQEQWIIASPFEKTFWNSHPLQHCSIHWGEHSRRCYYVQDTSSCQKSLDLATKTRRALHCCKYFNARLVPLLGGKADQTFILAWEMTVCTALRCCSIRDNAGEFMRVKFLFGLNKGFSCLWEDICYKDGLWKPEEPHSDWLLFWLKPCHLNRHNTQSNFWTCLQLRKTTPPATLPSKSLTPTNWPCLVQKPAKHLVY